MAKSNRPARSVSEPTPATSRANRPPQGSPKNSFWEGLSEPTQHLICAALMLLVAVVFFSATTFGDKSLVGSDVVHARAMAKSALDFEAQTGEQTLWIPNGFGGMPAYSVYYPVSIPQMDTIVRSLNQFLAFPFVPFLIMLFGMYWLGFYLTKDKLLGLFGAFAYSLTTYLPLILLAGHNTKFSTLAWTPWLILAFLHVLRYPKLLSGLLFAAALAVNLRSNHIQITYYVAFILGVWWIFEAISAGRKGETKSFGIATGLLVMGVLLAVLMVAQPYWPLAEYKAFTTRGASEGGGSGALDWTYAMNWSQGWGELWTLLFSRAYGGGSQEAYWGAKIFTGGPHYIGGIVILLAVFALLWSRKQVVWALGTGTLLTVLFALGQNAAFINEPMFHYFPLFNAFRVPETWLIISVMGLVLLAVLGLKQALQPHPTGKTDPKPLYYTIGGMVALMLILILFKSALFTFEKPNETEEIAKMMVQQYRQQGQEIDLATARTEAPQYIAQFREDRLEGYQSDALRTLFFIVLAGLLLILAKLDKIPAWTAKLALSILVLADLWGVASRYYTNDLLKPKTNVEEQAAAQIIPGIDDWIQERVKTAGGAGHFRTFPMALDPFQDGRTPFFYETVSGYSAAKLRVYQDYQDHVLQDKEGRINMTGLDLMAVRYIIARGILPGTKPVQVAQDSSMLILERENPMPRAWLVSETKTVNTPQEKWRLLQDPTFNPRKTALVAKDPGLKTAPFDSLGRQTSVKLKSFTANRIEWKVQTDAPRLMVASEIYYPAGWAATVDGNPSEIIQTNHILRGVAVPAGSHTVVMTFIPERHFVSKTIAGGATVLCYGGILLLLGLALMRRRKEAKEKY
ncbi:MAG: YfhO family protein [Bacteroidetes Order II. Incertae sedis bacterium]|nr:YfhO family protein [Bacteroidetes Order II. bacterium]